MAEGRMIKKEIAKSKKIAFLKNEKARSLYFMIYPHVDVSARISADTDDIKAICIPLFGWNNEDIESALMELHNIGLIILYIIDDRKYLEIVRFHDFQRINKNREAESKIPPFNSKNPRVIQSTPEHSSISKVKLSKDNKEQPEADKLLKEVYKKGLNIHQLINKLKKQMKWTKEQRFPAEVIIAVCRQYLRERGKITKEWGWFAKVMQAESAAHFARKNVEEGKKWKNTPVALSLKEIMKGIK